MMTQDRLPWFVSLMLLMMIEACAHDPAPAPMPAPVPPSVNAHPGTILQKARREAQRLRAELASVKIASAKLAAELNSVKEEAERLRIREHELGEKVKALQEQVVALEADRERLRRENAELQAKTAALPTFQRMADQLEAQQVLLQQLTGTVHSLTTALEAMKQEVLKTQQIVLKQSPASAIVALAGGKSQNHNEAVQNIRVLVVEPGDTLWRIARTHGVSIHDLQQLNGLTSSFIRVGQRLKIPVPPERSQGASPGLGTAFPETIRPSSIPETVVENGSKTDMPETPSSVPRPPDRQNTD